MGSLIIMGVVGLIVGPIILSCNQCRVDAARGIPMFLTIASAGVAVATTFWMVGFLEMGMTNSEEAGFTWAIVWMLLYAFTYCLLFAGSKILVISLAGGDKAKVVASGATTFS